MKNSKKCETTSQQAFPIEREKFLKASKRIHSYIKDGLPQTTSLTEVHDIMAKAFGFRNWQEMQPIFKQNIKDNGKKHFFKIFKEIDFFNIKTLLLLSADPVTSKSAQYVDLISNKFQHIFRKDNLSFEEFKECFTYESFSKNNHNLSQEDISHKLLKAEYNNEMQAIFHIIDFLGSFDDDFYWFEIPEDVEIDISDIFFIHKLFLMDLTLKNINIIPIDNFLPTPAKFINNTKPLIKYLFSDAFLVLFNAHKTEKKTYMKSLYADYITAFIRKRNWYKSKSI